MKKELATALNTYLANMGVMYIKLHNLHWNVVGSDFKQVHEYLETLYDAMAGVLDEVAELLKMQGEQPLASLKDYLAAASIQELPSAELRSREVLRIVQADLTLLRDQAQQIRADAAADDVYAVVSTMEEHLAQYNKTLWFVEAMQK